MRQPNIGQDTLKRMKGMKNNNAWVFDRIRPYLGETIFEIGSGLGTISQMLLPVSKKLIVTDINPTYVAHLEETFQGNPQVTVVAHDIASKNISPLKAFRCDTVVCINVLEHVRNDIQALRNMHELLIDHGRLILLVPAHKFLYGSLDKGLDHVTRYEKGELIAKLTETGFSVDKIWYHNFLATAGWLMDSRIFKKEIMPSAHIGFFDAAVPVLAAVERIMPMPFGLSLIAVSRKNGGKNVSSP